MKKLLSIALFFAAQGAFSQEQESLGRLELQVRERYEAQVAEAEKISDLPGFRDTTTKKLPVAYSTLSKSLQFKFRPDPLKPVRIAKTEVEQWPRYALDLGIGLYTTPWVRLQANSGRNARWQYTGMVEHYSTRGGVGDIAFDKWGADKTAADGRLKYMWSNYSLAQSINLYTRGSSYYGIPTVEGVTDTLGFSDEATRQRINALAYALNLENTGKQTPWFLRAGMQYQLTGDAYNSLENRLKLTSEWVFPVQKERILLGANLDYFRTNMDSLVRVDRSFFQLEFNPRIQSKWSDVVFSFGLRLFSNTAWNSRADKPTNTFYSWPSLAADYNIVPDVLRAYAQFDGKVINHSYRDFTEQNWLVAPGLDLRPEEQSFLKAGLTGKLSAKIGFGIEGFYRFSQNMPFFYRSPDFYTSNALGIDVVYDRVTTAGLTGNLEFLFGGITANLFGNLMSYDTEELAAAYHLPGFEAGVTASGWIKQKIGWDLRVQYTGKRTAYDAQLRDGLRVDVDPELPGFVDLGVNLTYRFNNNLNAFVKGFNLLNSPYQLYLGYPTQGIQLMMGVSYRL